VRIGVRIMLTRNRFPSQYFFFPISLTAVDGVPHVSVLTEEMRVDSDQDIEQYVQLVMEATLAEARALPSRDARTVDMPKETRVEIGFHAQMESTN
jgi:hypothetical protein